MLAGRRGDLSAGFQNKQGSDMASTIGELDYKIIADTEQFEKATKVSQKEIREMNKAVRETQTPLERYQKELDKLNNLRRKGLISAEQYRRAVDRARQSHQQATKTTQTHAKSVMSLQKAHLALAIAVAGTLTAVRALADAFQDIDRLAKAADRLGVSIGQLQALQAAAAQTAGMTAEQFDNAFQRIIRRVAQAAKGMGEAQEAIKTLGLDAEQLASMRPDEMFKTIADAVARIPNDAERLRLTVALADSEGAKLANTFKAGSETLEMMEDTMKRMGVILDREQAAKVEELNDRLDTMGRAYDGIKQQLALGIAPVMGDIAEDAERWLKATEGVASLSDKIRIGSRGLYAAIKGLVTGEDEVQRLFGEELARGLGKALEGEPAAQSAKQVAEALEAAAQDGSEAKQRAEAAEELATAAVKMEKTVDKIQQAGALGSPPGFQSGSREEYQWRVMQQRQRQQADEQRRANQRAERQREINNERLGEANERLARLVDKTQSVQGV